MRLVLTGGGTGGHVYPNLAVADVLGRRWPDSEIVYIGSNSGLEATLVAQAGLAFHAVASAPLLGSAPHRLALGVAALARGIVQSYGLLRRLKADAVLATGGYVSAPVVLAAWLRRVPSLVYLPDIVPGWSVQLLAKVADRVAVTHPESTRHLPTGKAVVTGYPVRPEVGAWSKDAARQRLGLPVDGLVLLVWGGSRGARSINRVVLHQLEELAALATIFHITGVEGAPEAQSRRNELSAGPRERYRVYPYLDDEFAAALAAADLAVSRAGASVMGEYPVVGLPSVLVPYPGLVRQQENALALVKAGGAVMIADDALDGLLPLLNDLLSRPNRLERMAEAARSLAPVTPGAEALTELLVSLTRHSGQVAAPERSNDLLVQSREG